MFVWARPGVLETRQPRLKPLIPFPIIHYGCCNRLLWTCYFLAVLRLSQYLVLRLPETPHSEGFIPFKCSEFRLLWSATKIWPADHHHQEAPTWAWLRGGARPRYQQTLPGVSGRLTGALELLHQDEVASLTVHHVKRNPQNTQRKQKKKKRGEKGTSFKVFFIVWP